jgi:hypothetical protein
MEIERIIVWGQPEAPFCPLSYTRSVNRKITVQAGLGINVRPYLKNN